MKLIEPSVTILDHNNINPQKYIESIARICYKSEDKITDDSHKKFISMLCSKSHFAMLEHFIFTYKIPYSIYRILESVGDIQSRFLKISFGFNSKEAIFVASFSARTLIELYEPSNYSSESIKEIMEKVVYDYECPELFCNKIEPKDHPGIEKMEDGDFDNYEISSVNHHRWMSAKFICDRGISHELVRHRDASFAQESSRYCISGDSVISKTGMTIKELYKVFKYGANMKICSCDDKGVIIENDIVDVMYKGTQPVYELITKLGYSIKATEDHEFMTNLDNFKQLKDLNIGDSIMVNGRGKVLNIDESDLDTLQYQYDINISAITDEIISIQYVGEESVYDIQMKKPYHNFIANGIVVHNCNYNKDKFGSEITFITPKIFRNVEKHDDDISLAYAAWKESLEKAEGAYFDLIDMNITAENARSVLPNSTKTEIVVTASYAEWLHIIDLRCDKHAHPDMIDIMTTFKNNACISCESFAKLIHN